MGIVYKNKNLLKLFLQDTNSERTEMKECISLCTYFTVWKYVQSWSKEGSDVGLIYLFIKFQKPEASQV